MKIKKKSILDINLGKVLEVAEDRLEDLWISSEKKLEKWLGSSQKPKHRIPTQLEKKDKERRKELQEIAKAQDYRLEMNLASTKNQDNRIAIRLSRLESQNQETSQELNRL